MTISNISRIQFAPSADQAWSITVGTAALRADQAHELVRQLVAAASYAYSEDIDLPYDWDDGYLRYPVSVLVGGVQVASATCWQRVGYLPPHAHADLDGSGLQVWGDARPYAEFRALSCDGQGKGDQDLQDAWLAWLREAASDVAAAALVATSDDAPYLASQDLAEAIETCAALPPPELALAEPTPVQMWDSMDFDDNVPGCALVRVGHVMGAPVAVADLGDGSCDVVMWPTAEEVLGLMRRAVSSPAGVVAANVAVAQLTRT